jgi:membrane dipeptidase
MRFATINALGVLDNPNLLIQPGGIDPAALARDGRAAAADARALADARASGLCAVHMTLGHVAGPDEPFEASVWDIAFWDAFIRRHPESLRKVLVGADIDAAREAGQVGVIYGAVGAA